AASPVFQSDHLAPGIGDEGLVAFQHGRNLFALIRMDQQNDFIVTHEHSLWISSKLEGSRPESVNYGVSRLGDEKHPRVRQGKPAIITGNQRIRYLIRCLAAPWRPRVAFRHPRQDSPARRA